MSRGPTHVFTFLKALVFPIPPISQILHQLFKHSNFTISLAIILICLFFSDDVIFSSRSSLIFFFFPIFCFSSSPCPIQTSRQPKTRWNGLPNLSTWHPHIIPPIPNNGCIKLFPISFSIFLSYLSILISLSMSFYISLSSQYHLQFLFILSQ